MTDERRSEYVRWLGPSWPNFESVIYHNRLNLDEVHEFIITHDDIDLVFKAKRGRDAYVGDRL